MEFGEVKDTLDEICTEYVGAEGGSISGRPYLVKAPQEIFPADSQHCYREFRRLVGKLQKEEGSARGTINALAREKDFEEIKKSLFTKKSDI